MFVRMMALIHSYCCIITWVVADNVDYVAAHFITPLWAKWEKSDYLSHVKHLQTFQYLSPEEIKKTQWQKIKALLNHAYENCLYYNELFNKMRLHPDDILSWSDFEKIPLLTKDKIRNKNDIVHCTNCRLVRQTLT